MILESLITDETKVTLDCCKALITRGGLVEIADEFWNNREVQGAIRGGFIRLVGNPPAQPVNVAGQPERKFRLRNCSASALALECTKGRVGPGDIVEVGEQQLNTREVQNAISWRFLEDLDNPQGPQEDIANDPAKLEELTSQDIEFASLLPESPAKTTIVEAPKNKNRAPVSRNKAKPITASSGREDDLYRPSQVIDRQPAGRQAAEPSAPIELDIGGGGASTQESNDDFSFGDIFNR